MNVEFTDAEKAILKGLIRLDLRKQSRGVLKLKERYGPLYDPTRTDARRLALESAYTKLGGNIENIENLSYSEDE